MHAPSIIASVYKGLIPGYHASGRLVFQNTPGLAQHSELKTHPKKRWFLEIHPLLCHTHGKIEPMMQFLWHNMSWVLIMSTNISQEKTWCFIMHLAFQIVGKHLGGTKQNLLKFVCF
jgi:hypothetical protein